MTVGDRWICQVCWKSNHPQAIACWKCKTPRDIDTTEVETQRKVVAAQTQRPEAVPDIVVALPVVIFRGYAKSWLRGGLALLALPVLLGVGGVTDVGYLLLSAGFAAGLIIVGFAAGEVAEGMRDREVWAYILGVVLSVVGAIGSVLAFEAFAGDLVNPIAIRWFSLLVFGGAGLAAGAGLVLLVGRRNRPDASEAVTDQAPGPDVTRHPGGA
jgi:hypothetical protein